MTTTLLKPDSDERKRDSDREEAGLAEAVIRDHVLSAIGRPDHPYHIQVKRVWGDNYRVNVFTGPDVVSFKVAHSYFLSADGNGKILTCHPPLARAY